MVRATFILVEQDPGAALSTRKLVVETAKFNILTAHSTTEAAEMFGLFPTVNAVIVTASMGAKPVRDLLALIKQSNPAMPIVWISTTSAEMPEGADYHVPTFEPDKLVTLLRSLFGDPRPQQAKPD